MTALDAFGQGVTAGDPATLRALDTFSHGLLSYRTTLGRSHAQRDLFDQFPLDSYRRSGRLIEARQMLELRRAHDPDGIVLSRLLADVYRRLDLVEPAEQAAARVARRLAG